MAKSTSNTQGHRNRFDALGDEVEAEAMEAGTEEADPGEIMHQQRREIDDGIKEILSYEVSDLDHGDNLMAM